MTNEQFGMQLLMIARQLNLALAHTDPSAVWIEIDGLRHVLETNARLLGVAWSHPSVDPVAP